MHKPSATSAPGELKVVPSTCSECAVHCGSLVYVRDGVIEDIKPNPKHPLSKGAFCIKGLKGPTGLTYSDKRLLYPMRRTGERGEGKWERISWDEALGHAADRYAATRGKYGPLSLVGICNNANVARGVAVVLLLRSLGSPNWMINQDLCGGCRAVSSRATGLDITRGEDVDHARCALVVGRNSYEADPIEWIALKKLKKRGGQIIVIDPKRMPTVGIADLWLRPKPGTDAAIGLAMIHVMITEGLYDKDFVERFTHGFDKLRERAGQFTPERAEALTGVPAKDIVAAARMYANGPSTFVSGHGIDAFSAGVQTFRAFHCLVGISGNVDRPGGNRRVKKPKGFLDNLQVVHDPKFRLPKDVEDRTLGADKYPLWAGPRGWQTACHNPTAIDAILTGKPYPVRAAYVSGANIVVTYPNTPKTVDALRSLDFLMVASDTMTPTAELADIVLPKTTALEEDDIRLQPGGPLITMTQVAIPPRGEARNDLEIALGLFEKMQARGAVTKNFLPWKNEDEFIEYLLGDSGVTLETLRRDGYAMYPFTLENFDKFPSPTGKLELYSEAIASVGVDPLPNYVEPARDSAGPELKAKFPLTLLTGDREKTYHHSRFRDQPWAKKISPDPRLLIHPETAKAMAVGPDQWVRIETPGARGTCKAKIKITEDTPEGVVSTGMGWWRPGSMVPGSGAFDVNINAAMTYDGPWDPISGSVEFTRHPLPHRRHLNQQGRNMGVIEDKLKAMGLTLPTPRKFPSPNRRGCVRSGNIIFVSGHGAHHPDMKFRGTGKLGADMTLEEGKLVARVAAVTILATVKHEVGDLDRVRRVIRLFGMVNCTPDFPDMPAVIDGASDLMFELFGPENGCHARSAIGMVNLPRGIPVEINGEFEVKA